MYVSKYTDPSLVGVIANREEHVELAIAIEVFGIDL